MPTVLVAGPYLYITQDSPFLPQRWPKRSSVLKLHLPTEGWSSWVGLVASKIPEWYTRQRLSLIPLLTGLIVELTLLCDQRCYDYTKRASIVRDNQTIVAFCVECSCLGSLSCGVVLCRWRLGFISHDSLADVDDFAQYNSFSQLLDYSLNKYWLITVVCEDVNECDLSPRVCSNADCNNTIGSYFCTCLTGFQSNGTHCVGMAVSLMQWP